MAVLDQPGTCAKQFEDRVAESIVFEDGSGDPYGWMLDAVDVENLPRDAGEAAMFVDGWIIRAARRSGPGLISLPADSLAEALRTGRPEYYRQVCAGVLAVADRWRAATTSRRYIPRSG